MRNKQILKLAAGFRRFRDRYFLKEGSIYTRLATAQAPKTLIIGCSDSRVDPAMMTSASPGDVFIVRNVANLVPPFEPQKSRSRHGVSAAIEFAVENLKVENILILGHRQCGGIRALVTGSHNEGSFIGPWVGIAKKAKDKVVAAYPGADVETLCRHCEMEAIVTSMQNLKTFPFVKAAMETRNLEVLGIYFDLEQGHLWEYDEVASTFKQIEIGHKEKNHDF